MAESHHLDLYSCDICMENMLQRDPKLLWCHHSFCAECLVMLVKQGQIECPTCRVKTSLPKGEVQELQSNFMLHKVKEYVDNLVTVKHVLCQLCKSDAAYLKCQECAQLFCEVCSHKHNKIKTFADHHLYKLCKKHTDGMAAYICIQCVQPVCSTCVIIEHSEHETDIKPFTEGTEYLISDIEKLKLQLKEKEGICRETLKKEEVKAESAAKAEHALSETIEELSMKLETEKENLKALRKFTEEENSLIIKSKQEQKEFENANEMLVKLSSTLQTGNLDDFNVVKEQVQRLLSRKHSFPVIPENIFLQDPVSGEKVALINFLKGKIVPKKVTFVEKPELVKTVPCPYQEGWSSPYNISFFTETSVIITDYGRNTVTIAYQTGLPAEKVLVPTGYGNIIDTVVFGEHLYFLFKDFIVRRSKSGVNKELVLKPTVSDMRRCLVVSESCLVILSDRKLHLFDSNTNTTEQVVDRLNDPNAVSLGYPGGKKTFAVVCRGTSNVILYDRSWNMLHTLGGHGQFADPWDVVFTPNGPIVADTSNYRLSLYDFEGKFVKHLMEKIQGYPDGLVFSYPYIWVVCNIPKTVSLFRICNNE